MLLCCWEKVSPYENVTVSYSQIIQSDSFKTIVDAEAWMRIVLNKIPSIGRPRILHSYCNICHKDQKNRKRARKEVVDKLNSNMLTAEAAEFLPGSMFVSPDT
jgi:hypothetical protein